MKKFEVGYIALIVLGIVGLIALLSIIIKCYKKKAWCFKKTEIKKETINSTAKSQQSITKTG